MELFIVTCFKAFRAGAEDGLLGQSHIPTWISSYPHLKKHMIKIVWEEGCHLGKQIKKTIERASLYK